MPPSVKRQRVIDCDGCGCHEDGCSSCAQGSDNPVVTSRTHNDDKAIQPPQQTNNKLPAVWAEAKSGSQRPPGAQDSLNPAASPAAPTHCNPLPKPAPPALVSADAEPDQELSRMVAGLDATVLRDLVGRLVSRDALLADAVRQAYITQPPSRQQTAPEQTQRFMRPAIPLSQMLPVLDFDGYSKRAWHALNDGAFLSMSGSHQFEEAGDVYDEICDYIGAIDERTKAESPLGTKLSALETLRKIAKTIILGEDTVGNEVRKEMQFDSDIPDVMIRVLESMTPEERIRAGKDADSKGTLISKVEWVQDMGKRYCLDGLSGLDKVLHMMKTGLSTPGIVPGASSAPIDLTS